MTYWKTTWVLFCCVAVLGVLSGSQAAGTESSYYCLEDYIPIGDLIRNVTAVSSTSTQTSGETARSCASACDAEPRCTAFRAVGAEAVSGPSCSLLTNTTGNLPVDLTLPAGAKWPNVFSDMSADETFQLRSVVWLCLKTAALWDTFGAATHTLIHTGLAGTSPGGFDHEQWCVFGTDVAGTNLQQYTSIETPLQCDWLCTNTSGCTIWTYAAAKPGSGQQPYNCFVKADPFKGQNGWTGPPKSDIWIPDSQVDCFLNLGDWRQLGLILSPAIKTIDLNGTYYTVYPERVTWAEANATCSKLPDGRLAILDSRLALDTTYRQLLTTLPSQTAVQSAWVGAAGNNTYYSPAASNQTGVSGQTGGVSQALLPTVNRTANATGPEGTLRWLNGQRVAHDQIRRLISLPAVWTVHDVIWNQQYIAANAPQVCGRLLIQTPPTNPQPGTFNPADWNTAFLPGVWYFDCAMPAAFICESSAPPADTMTGRTVVVPGAEVPSQASGAVTWRVVLAVVLPVTAVALAVLLLSRIYGHKSRLPALIWQQRKRALGPPRSGRMSIVVTDIQGYTQLTNEAPEDMAQALLQHNQVIKHAVYDQVGYVIEQEGDSFTITFYEPEDAVAFTLQVQQALLQQPWAPTIQYHDAWEPSSEAPSESGGQGKLAHHASGLSIRPSLDLGLNWLRSLGPASPTAAHSQVAGMGTAYGPAAAADSSQAEQRVLNWIPDFMLPSSRRRRSSEGSQLSTISRAAGPDSVWTRSASPAGMSCSTHGPGAGPSIVNAAHTGSLFSFLQGRRKHGSWLEQLLVPQSQQPQLFRGLRVRMGIATGVVAKGQDVKRSALYTMAQDVSTAANGGQVLMDEVTFIAVKESMRRLGLVTASGLDYDALYASSRRSHGGSKSPSLTLLSTGRGGGSSRASGGSRKRARWSPMSIIRSDRGSESSQTNATVDAQQHAVALDMGCYEVSTPAARSGTAATSSRSSACILWIGDMGAKLVQQYQQYLQHQELQLPEGFTDQTEHNSTTALHALGVDIEQPASPYSSYSDSAYSSPGQQHHQEEQRDALQYGGVRRSSSNRGVQELRQLSGQGMGWRKQLNAMQREQLGVSRHKSTVQMVQQPQNWWQHFTRGLLGLGVIEHEPAGSSLELQSWQSTTAASSSSWANAAMRTTPVSIRIYQIVSPSLIGRAALFGCKMSLPSSWRCLDAPYFAAPGLNVADSSCWTGDTICSATSQLPTPPADSTRQPSDGSLAITRGDTLQSSLPQRSSGSFTEPYSPHVLRSKSKGNLPVVRSGQSLATMVQQDPNGWGEAVHVPDATAATESATAGSTVSTATADAQEVLPAAQHGLAPVTPRTAVPAPAMAVAAAPGLALAALGAAGQGNSSSLPRLQLQPGAHSNSTAQLLQNSPFAALDVNNNAAATAVEHNAGLTNQGGSATRQLQLQQPAHVAVPVEALSTSAAAEPHTPPNQDMRTTISAEHINSRANNQLHQPHDATPAIPFGVAKNAGQVPAAVHGHGTELNSAEAYRRHVTDQTSLSNGTNRNAVLQASASAADKVPLQLADGMQHAQVTSNAAILYQADAAAEAAAAAALGATGAPQPASPARQHPTLLPASSIASSMAMMSLTGAASPVGVRTSLDTGIPRSPVLKFPPVSIVFASVEGGAQLAKHAELARAVHGIVHRLMLQLLRQFAGSYLIRAQAGELKYLAAFTTPSMAAAWCLTVQEASLYLPYPAELLSFSSFGVQLDAKGRLVFRGPRFKMGLNEGIPTCILPDHLGRADYHGAFVNQAARYADAAAHGGQVVTDRQLASKILQQWRSSSINPSSSSSIAAVSTTAVPVSSTNAQAGVALHEDQGTSNSSGGGGFVLPNARLKPSRSVPADLGSSVSNTADTAGTLLQLLKAPVLHIPAASAAAQTGASSTAANLKLPLPPLPMQMKAVEQTVSPGASAADGVGNSSHTASPAPPAAAAATTSSSSAAAVPIECSWLGSFMFKGNPKPVEMVSLGPAVLQGRSYPSSAPAGKGMRVVQRVGVMDRVVVQLPAVVEDMYVTN